MGSGPSVRHYLGEIDEHDEVWAINGAYDWLATQGLIAGGFIGMDPLPGLVEYVQRPARGTTFYIASICDPSVFDALGDHDVMIWHPEAENMIYKPDDFIVTGGTTAATRAPFIALALGWRDITLYGVDSCYEDDAAYVYKWGTYACDIDNPKCRIACNGEGPFTTEVGMMKQVSQLGVIHRNFRGMLKFRCGGLMEAFIRAPMESDEGIEITNAA